MFPHQKESANFVSGLLATPREYSSQDISVIISIRAHGGNPWVLERLAALRSFYNPSPHFIIVDFGSDTQYAEAMRAACTRDDLQYVRMDDTGVFSLSLARNAGAAASTSDLLYFTDIDFFSTPEYFGNLARYANDHDFRFIRDIVLNVPAYHLTEASTSAFYNTPKDLRRKYLEQIATIATENSPTSPVEFIAPYSNNFLCTRDFYQMVGGYDPEFRGHGSEDFELMIRFALYSRHAVLPAEIEKDLHKPTSAAFFSNRPYAGFRRLGEAVSFRSEIAGFRAFHFWHPCPPEDPWRQSNDWSRNRFATSLSRYLDSPEKLGHVDHMPREKTALCICRDAEHYGYFLPFRTLGYRLELMSDDSPETIALADQKLSAKDYDLFVVFNPYMKSHAGFFTLFEKAKETGVEVVVVERGALPSTIYYAPDVSYNDPDFRNYAENPPQMDTQSLHAADAICEKIRTGAWTLENLTGYQETLDHHSSQATNKPRVFIPLQLCDDMAVTKFVTPTQSYADFENSIVQTAEKYPDITFVVKAHPLNRQPFSGSAPNVLVCKNDDNVHAVIESCDATICYNSGVGLLSLIHGKPTFTIGNAFYNVPGTGHRLTNFAEAVAKFSNGAPPPDLDSVRTLIAWLVSRKYSYFMADDLIREFKERNSHGYKNIRVTQFNWKDIHLSLGRTSAQSRIGKKSYTNGRLGLMIGIDPMLIQSTFKPRGAFKNFVLNCTKRPWRRMMRRLKSTTESNP